MTARSDVVARWCGWAAALGGLMWATKAVAILVTGDQPPLLFELPVALLPVGLLGLRRRLGPRGGRLGAVGGRLAAAAALAGVTRNVWQRDSSVGVIGRGTEG